MAAPPPRKFGEKIALLQQKEAEHSAAFESVMADVQNITRQRRKGGTIGGNIAAQNSSHSPPSVSTTPHQQHTSPTRLPSAEYSINISSNNSTGFYPTRDNLQEAVNDLQSLKKEVYPSSPTSSSSSQRHYSPHHPHHRASTSPVGRISAPHNHKSNHLPTHLSPPPDGLPRSNSVPSLIQHSQSSSYPVSPPHESDHLSVQFRPKSSLDVTHQQSGSHIRSANMSIPTSGMSLLHSLQHQQLHGEQSGLLSLANTGSLPDLTMRSDPQQQLPSASVRIALPQGVGHYSRSLTNGPVTSSPQGQSPQSGTSPGPSPSLSRRHKTSPYPSPHSRNSSQGTVSVDPSAVDAGGGVTCGTPGPYGSHQQHYLFNSPPGAGGGSIPSSPNRFCNQQQQQQSTSPNHFSQFLPQSSSRNKATVHQYRPFQSYRNPPSPQLSPRSSPGPPNPHTAAMAPVTVGSVYRSSSPDGRSAPPSPVCGALNHTGAHQTSPSPVSSPGLRNKPFAYDNVQIGPLHPIQHRFEKITVMDIPPNSREQPMNTEFSSSSNYQSPSSPVATIVAPCSPLSSAHQLPQINTLPSLNSQQVPQSPLQQAPPSPTPSLGSHSPATPVGSIPQGTMNMNPTTPQTPNSIPKVVLTDHDGNNDILKEFTAEFTDFAADNENFDILSHLDADDVNMLGSLDYSGTVTTSDDTNDVLIDDDSIFSVGVTQSPTLIEQDQQMTFSNFSSNEIHRSNNYIQHQPQ